MTRRSRFVLILTVALGLVLACGPISTGLSPSPTGGTSSNSPSEPASSTTGEPATQEPALVPNPLNVTITLDTANAKTSAGFVLNVLGRQDVNGTYPFQLNFPPDMASIDADGIMVPETGTPVTVTPVTAIEGIPFSQGYLKAVNLSPEGLLMIAPASLKLTLPGEYDPATLVGFAADGNGNNFHLYPALINVVPLASGYGGFTEVTFDVLHFTMYGVAQATVQEILAQHARVPEGQSNQDDDLLAPLPPVDEARSAVNQRIIDELRRQHDLQIKPAIDRVFGMDVDCNYVDVVAQQFITWHTRVEALGFNYEFEEEIDRDTAVLLAALFKCMQIPCSLCMGTPPGDRREVDKFLIHAFYAEQIANIAGDYEGVHRWDNLANACAQNTGRPLPNPGLATCGLGCSPGAPNPTPPACPVP